MVGNSGYAQCLPRYLGCILLISVASPAHAQFETFVAGVVGSVGLPQDWGCDGQLGIFVSVL